MLKYILSFFLTFYLNTSIAYSIEQVDKKEIRCLADNIYYESKSESDKVIVSSS